VRDHPNSVSFRDLTLEAFVDRLASAEPVPGGGSASAVAASLGAALVAMVAALSDRPKYADHVDTHAWAGAMGRSLAGHFLELADADSAAYGELAAALKLPRETDEQKTERTRAVRSAAKAAAEVPLKCIEACLELVRAAEALAGRSNTNASSDLNVAALLGEAAARGAAANVYVNLPSLGDASAAARMSGQVDELLGHIEAVARATREAVSSGASRAPLAAVGRARVR
jgi:formiminotetrahydrofolate cyclodeaminase